MIKHTKSECLCKCLTETCKSIGNHCWQKKRLCDDAIWNMKNLPNAMRCILKDRLTQKEKFDAEGNKGESTHMDEDIARLFRSKSPHGFS